MDTHSSVVRTILFTEAKACCCGFSTTTPQSGRPIGATVPSMVTFRPSMFSSYDSVSRSGAPAFSNSCTILRFDMSGRRTSTDGSLWISTLPLRSTRKAVTSIRLPSSRMRSLIRRRLTSPSTTPMTWPPSITGTATTTHPWLAEVRY